MKEDFPGYENLREAAPFAPGRNPAAQWMRSLNVRPGKGKSDLHHSRGSVSEAAHCVTSCGVHSCPLNLGTDSTDLCPWDRGSEPLSQSKSSKGLPV